jgi:type IV secretion system protein VirB8
MESINDYLPEYIKSGKYFEDAKGWYKYKYIHPFTQRSFVFLLCVIILVLFLGIIVNVNKLFPFVVQVKYIVDADTSRNKAVRITRANQIKNDPLLSIVDVMIRNYVIRRENYNYYNLQKQFIHVKNNSTRITFRRFYNYMNIDNPSSPVLRYQKNSTSETSIVSTQYPGNSKAIVRFNSIAKNRGDKIIDNKLWQAEIDYQVDAINTDLPTGSRFNFTVNNYQLKLLKDNLNK